VIRIDRVSNEIIMTKNLIVVAFILSLFGCHALPEDLAAKRGWRVDRLGYDRFRIFVPASEPNPQFNALPVAASILLRNGFDVFEMVRDEEFPQDGTTFVWGDSYGGGQGLFEWKIGGSFLVKGYGHRPEGMRVLVAKKFLDFYMAEQTRTTKP
jgi:hypothetical protein